MNTNTSRKFEIIFTTSNHMYYTQQDNYNFLATYYIHTNNYIITIIKNHPLKNISTRDIYSDSETKLLDMIYQEQI